MQLEIGTHCQGGRKLCIQSSLLKIVLQQAGRGHSAGRQHDVFPKKSAAVGAVYADDRKRILLGMQQSGDLPVGVQPEIGLIFDSPEHTHFGIGFIAAHAGKTVKMLGLFRILQNGSFEPQGQRLGSPAGIGGHDFVDQLLQLGLVFKPVDVQQLFGLIVKWRQFIVAKRPGQALKIRIGFELMGRKAQQRGTIPFGFAAHVVELGGNKGVIPVVHPSGLVLVAALFEDGFDIQRAAVPGQHTALFQHENLSAGFHQIVGSSTAAGTRTDDNRIVLVFVHCLYLLLPYLLR